MRLLSASVLFLAAAVVFAAQLVAGTVEAHTRSLAHASGHQDPEKPEVLTLAGWVAVAGFTLAGLVVIVMDGWRVATRTVGALPPEPVGPDDTSSPAPCPACRATIPAGVSRCPACGWTYATVGGNPTELSSSPDRGGRP